MNITQRLRPFFSKGLVGTPIVGYQDGAHASA